MFIGQLLLWYGFEFRQSRTICSFAASASHFFLLAAFFCVNVISFDLCSGLLPALPAPSRDRRRRFKVPSLPCLP